MKKIFISILLILALVLTGCQNLQACKHADIDNNGLCDDCQASVVVTFDFYTINDLHGKFADSNDNVGVDEMTSYFRNARLADENVILLSAGDMWQGSAESNSTRGQLIVDWMNDLDFTAMSMGNHEFDWGEEYIKSNAEMAEFPFLAINIYDRETNAQVDYCSSSVLVDADGMQIGIIGAIGDCYSSIASDHTQGIYFKTGAELTELVKAESTMLKEKGADFIVYVLHDGYEYSKGDSVTTVDGSKLKSYYDISLSDGYVDLVFEGHTHQKYMLRDEYGVLHLQHGGDNDGISHIEITLNSANGNKAVYQKELVSADYYGAYRDDPIVEQLLEKYSDVLSKVTENLGTAKRKMTGQQMCDIIARLYYETGVEKWGDEYEIALGGGFMSIRSPYDIQPGNVTYGMLQTIFPFDNELVLCSIKGSDLKDRFINTTNTRYYIYENEAITSNIDPNGTYYVIVDSYSSTYKSNRLTEIERYGEAYYGRDMLAEYFKNGGL